MTTRHLCRTRTHTHTHVRRRRQDLQHATRPPAAPGARLWLDDAQRARSDGDLQAVQKSCGQDRRLVQVWRGPEQARRGWAGPWPTAGDGHAPVAVHVHPADAAKDGRRGQLAKHDEKVCLGRGLPGNAGHVKTL